MFILDFTDSVKSLPPKINVSLSLAGVTVSSSEITIPKTVASN